MESRHEEMRLQAQIYHMKYPLVWNLFATYTFEVINKGFKNYGAKSIFERIRWETDTPDVDGKSTFKINNNYTSFYARRFMRMYPHHKGFFRIREQISKSTEATGQSELMPQDYKYINEI